MKIGIISDVHDNGPNLLKAIDVFKKKEVEIIIHCGDWGSPGATWLFMNNCDIRTISVFGNNDKDLYRFFTYKEKYNWDKLEYHGEFANLELEGKKIAVYHGNVGEITEALVLSGKWEVVISGHDHVSNIESVNGVLHINPGTINCLKAGKIENDFTVAIYDLGENQAEIIKL
ncbi:MAG: metallophosphoesterase [Candidatus Moraniibacteriota bacterium]